MEPTTRILPALALSLSLALAAITVGAPSTLLANPCDDDTDRHIRVGFDFGFGDWRKGVTVREDFQERIAAPDGAWRVEGGQNGAIALSGTEGNEAFVCAQIHAWAGNEAAARELAREVRIVVDARGVRSEGPPQKKKARWTVAFHIFVPRATDVEARTENGPISVEGTRSRLDLETVNGPISVSKSGGDVRGRTTNGPLDVTLVGARWSGRGLDLESTNGPVSVVVPRNFSAELEFGTSNGPMAFDFPVTVQGRVSKSIKTTLGSGGPLIRVYTMNGPATLQRD